MRNLRLRAFHRGEGTPQGASGARNGEGRRSGVFNRIITAAVALTATVALAVPTAYAVTADMSANASNTDSSVQAGNADNTIVDDATANTGGTDNGSDDATADTATGDTANTGGTDNGTANSADEGAADAADAGTSTGDENNADADSDSGVDSQSDVDESDNDGAADSKAADPQATPTGDLLLDETFMESSAGELWRAYGDACLTAADTVDYNRENGDALVGCRQDRGPLGVVIFGNDRTVATSSLSGQSNGALQLTDNGKGRNGTVLYARAIPASDGLDITFTQYQSKLKKSGLIDDVEGGQTTAADGIGFYLVDASAGADNLTPGPSGTDVGGALGYATYKGKAGIANGVLGIGLDVYGNFSNTKEAGGKDCQQTSSSQKNSVAIRGEGNGTTGYCLVTSKSNVQLETDGLPKVGSDYGKDDTGKQVHIVISPQPDDESKYSTVTVEIDGTTVLDEVSLGYRLPKDVMFGFTASTGQSHQPHFIRNLKANTVEKTSGIILNKSIDTSDSTLVKDSYTVGDTVSYRFTITNSGEYELKNIKFTDEKLDQGTLTCAPALSDTTTLKPQNTITCTGQYTLQKEDVTDSGKFTNTASVTADPIADESVDSVKAEDTLTVNTHKTLGEPEANKRIRDNNDGTYTLALDVIGDELSGSGSGNSTPLDIVLVLDKSSSMDQSYEGWKNTKLSALKTAVKQFIEATEKANQDIADAPLQHNLSVVTFSDKAKSLFDLEAVNSKNIDSLKGQIDRIHAGGNTYPDKGFTEAEKQFKRNGRDKAKKVVIFFTDGVPAGGGTNDFQGGIAASAVNKAHELKQGKTEIYSIGVFKNADPNDTKNEFNAYMNAVSSNYPNATAQGEDDGFMNKVYFKVTWNGESQGDYYKVAKDSDELEDIFDEIGEDITKPQSYSDVWITDELSDYADLVDIITPYESGESGYAEENGFVKVKNSGERNEITVWKKAGNGASSDSDREFGNKVNASEYELWWNADKKAIRVKLKHAPKANEKYTLTFNIKPSEKAYTDHAKYGDYRYDSDGDGDIDNGDTEAKGDQGTDLPGNSTSEGKAGYRTNDRAYVSYKVGEEQKPEVDYAHPVLQVTDRSVDLDGAAFVTVKKVIENRDWGQKEQFEFKLSPKDNANPMPSGCTVDSCKLSIGKPAADADQTTNTSIFGKITFTKPGTYTYTLTEVVPENTRDLTYSQAEYEITVTVSADMKATVSVKQTKNDAGETTSEDVSNKIATFTNSATLKTTQGLIKTLDGREWDEDDVFTFLITSTDKGAIAPKNAKPVYGKPGQWTVAVGYKDLCGYDMKNSRCIAIGFETEEPTGGQHEYTYTVTEVVPDAGEALPGMTYSQAEWTFMLTIYGEPGEYKMTAQSVQRVTDDDGMTISNANANANVVADANGNADGEGDSETYAAIRPIEFTNRFGSVSDLPLTGGDATLRSILLAGGGLVLLAGGAWLLSRRRRA